MRQRNAGNIVNEIEYLTSRLGVRGILFRDPIFTANKPRAKKIAEMIIKKGLKIEWACETHFNYLDEELIDVMYESGLRSINVGIESVDAQPRFSHRSNPERRSGS